MFVYFPFILLIDLSIKFKTIDLLINIQTKYHLSSSEYDITLYFAIVKRKKYDVNWLSLCQRLSAVFSSWDKIGWKLTLDFCKLLRLGWRHIPKNVPYYLLQCTGLNMCILCVLYFCKPSRPTKTVAFFSALFLHVSFMMIYWR